MSGAVEVIDILDKWQRGEFHGRLEASFPDDRPRSIVSRESRFFGEGASPASEGGKESDMGNSCFGEVSEKRKECGETREREMERSERLNNMRAYREERRELHCTALSEFAHVDCTVLHALLHCQCQCIEL